MFGVHRNFLKPATQRSAGSGKPRMFESGDELPDDSEYEVVIPTAPEDELSSSFSSCGSLSSRLPKHPGSPSPFHPHNANNNMPFAPQTQASGPHRQSGKKSNNGLPSHAFSRNYYCRFCNFNTTKSKAHLYHLVDIHGVDIKIFSCDRCDYASKWKCKVIRHRKMIHKINEPKFEPEMHDSRGNTRRPAQSFPPSANEFAPSLSHGLPTAASPLSVMPASLGLLDQHPAMMQAVFNNNKPMEPFEKMATKPTPISVDNSSSSSRRKQRKPQNVCKVVNGDEDGEAIYVSPKSDPAETSGVEPANLETSKVKADTEGSYDLADLFGSKDDGSSSIFNGGGWRRNLKPTAVPHTNFLGNSTISPNEDKMAAQKSPNSGNQANLSSSHGSLGESLSIVNQQPSSSIKQTDVSRSRTVSKEEEMSAEDQITLINNKCVVEMMIDDDLHYRCSECNFISKYRWKSTKHYKANHVNAKLYQCSTCEFTTNNRIDFFSHKASHSSRGFQFMVPSFHQRLQHLQGMHKCAECGYVASNKNNLDRHLMNHRENHPVKCLYCSFSSTGEAAIQRHMAEHHSQSEVPISNSSKKASPEDLEEGSTNEFGEFSCEMCEYTARNWSKMKEHMIRHQDGTPFACSYCESKYKRPADLNRHLKIKHNTCLADIGLDGPTLKGVLSSSDSSHSFVPIVPGNQEMSASDSPYLTNLKRSHVAMESPTPGSESDNDEPKRLCIDEDGANMMSLKCPKCPYVAKWKSDLERHLKVHSEEKRFPCTVCYRSYKYHGDLNVHMRKAHPNVTPRPNNQKAAGGKTPPPNVQVISNEVIVNMSHAAILNPLANFGAPQHQSLPEMFNSITSTPQMPSLKPAPQASPITQPSSPSVQKPDSSSPEKKIKKGELDPSTMVHVPGGEFKCLNCCYETTFKSHLDAHMRLHPEKPFHCMFCNYASYWRGDTKKHIEKNHPDKLPAGINPYSFVEQVFEEAVRNSPHRHKPLPEVHHVHTGVKSDKNKSAGQIWTPPTKGDTLNNDDSQDSIGQHSNPPRASKNGSEEHNGPTQIQCPHCTYTTINESRLNGHMATHYNLKIYKCPECGKRANWKWDVQKHMKNDHPDVTTDVIVMDTEEARNSLDDYLKDHPEQRGKPRLGVAHDCKPENWPKPKPVTPTAIPTTSSGSGGSGQKATSIRPFRCSVCSRRSNWKCDIRKHYRQVHPLQTDAHVQVMSKEELLAAGEKPDDVESSYPEMKARPATTSAKPFRCSVCGKNSRWKWDVTKHIKMVHRDIPSAYVIEDGSLDSSLNNGEDSSNPLTPDASITSDQDMEREGSPFTSHSNSNPSTQSFKPPNGPKLGCYQCSVCSQFSEFMWVIRRHIRSLHPDNPDARIVDLSKKGEEASGNDSRPYICSLCGKRSNWKWDVKKHIMSVHRGNIGSILDELLNKETVIYADGKTMEVDNDAKEKIQLIRTQMVENGSLDSPSPTGPNKLFSQDSPSSSCYSSLPTMVGLHSVLAPESPDNQTEEEMEAGEISADRPGASSGPIKFKCGYCFYTSASRNETVRHVRTGHPGKILRIHTINRSTKDEQTTYKAAHRSSTSSSFSAWQCSQCSFRHANKEEALVHIQNHDLYHAYQCAICDHGDDIESNVLKHIKTKHEVDNPEGALLQNMHYGMLMDSQPGSPGDAMGGNSGVSYTCNQCDMKTSWRSAIVRHIKEKHMVLPEYDIGTMFTKHGTAIRSEVGGEVQTRRYNCTICPYKTDKVSMFNEHMSRHTKNSDTDAKCPYCDYWVAASRLLHQHLKIHQRTGDLDGVNITPASENGFNRMEPKNPTVGGLAQCPDCPYRGKTKDLNQHRRLHKKRPGAEYKCPECPYWVSHGRLLQQHAKVHSPSYRRAASESLSMSSNDTSHEDVDIAAFKQHMISQSIHAVNMELTESGSERQAYKCSKCPFSSIRRKKINEHEEMHGAIMDSGLKCKFCDYYAEDRDTIVQHIKVHSLQYKGEVEDCNEENMINNNPTFLESGAGYDLKGGDGLMANLERQATGAKYCCEKCSYCSSHKGNFVRHMKLHGSQQGYTCDYCDYSVPRRELLEPHTELHRQPNRNLLATQSIMNLTKLKPISADVQLAQSAQLVDGHLTEVHDHLDLYENDPNAPLQSTSVFSGRQPAFNRVESSEPEFIDLAELGSKVSADGMRHQEGGSRGPSEDDIEEDDEVWICRVCDRVLDSEQELVTHEKQHNE